ncbi:VOC family protein [Acidipila sp. EB88]|uniref:VOC family protein n=1 Tax=Acidipila sp. EB88 TaxID=2305226 RepID=UPI0018F3FDEF|nr:VOC family protein [Acidipila sp. EB88]
MRAENPKVPYSWYAEHLGLEHGPAGFVFPKAPPEAEFAIALFSRGNDYFPTAQPAMFNFRVDDLAAILDRLAAAGIPIDSRREQYEFGHFGWFTDPEGNRVEVWQPA